MSDPIELRPAPGWAIWGQAATPLYLCMTLRSGMNHFRDIFGDSLWTSVIFFEENQARWFYRPQELKQLGQRIIDLLANPDLRSLFVASYEQAEATLMTAIRAQSAARTSVSDSVTAFLELEEAYCKWYGYAWVCEPVQFRSTELLDNIVSDLATNRSLPGTDITAALYSSPHEPFATEITRHLATCAATLDALVADDPSLADVLSGVPALERSTALLESLNHGPSMRSEALMAQLDEHVSLFGWKRNNYQGSVHLSRTDILAEILEGAEDGTGAGFAVRLGAELDGAASRRHRLTTFRSELIPELSPYEQLVVNIGAKFGAELLDLRKRTIMMSNGAFEGLARSLATAADRPLMDIRHLVTAELPDYFRSPTEYDERLAERRQRFLVYQGDTSVLEEVSRVTSATGSALEFRNTRMPDPFLAEGPLLETTVARLNARLGVLSTEHAADDAGILRGVVAHRPGSTLTVRGTVGLVLNAQTDELQPGHILVAPSTTPDYMSAIRRSKAIITDWGGQTSHAAITARELDKPCIIGTGFATSVLASGVTVELNLETGIVRVVDT